jgi:hypothetical protein
MQLVVTVQPVAHPTATDAGMEARAELAQIVEPRAISERNLRDEADLPVPLVQENGILPIDLCAHATISLRVRRPQM